MPSLSSASQSNTVSQVLAYCSLPSSLSPSLPPSLSPPSLPPLSDGVGRTGTFICLHSQLERLKTEGVVDFFQAIKSARIQRAGLIPYAVCHKHYLTFPPSLLPSFPPSLLLLLIFPLTFLLSPPLRTSIPTVMRYWLILSTVMATMLISRKSCRYSCN